VPLGLYIKKGLNGNLLIPMESAYVVLIIADILIDFYLNRTHISLIDDIMTDAIRRIIIYIGSYLVIVLFGIDGYLLIPISSLITSQLVAFIYKNCKYKYNGLVWSTLAAMLHMFVVRIYI